MKANVRFLPHLNVVYLQQQSYLVHRKKIKIIQKSYHRLSKKQITNQQEISKNIQSNDLASKVIQRCQKLEMKAILEYQNTKKSRILSPFSKRKQFENKKENNRLYSQIKKSESTIKRNQIFQHEKRTNAYKSMITKFKQLPSNRYLLKSTFSLRQIQSKENKNLTSISPNISRLLSPNREKVNNETNCFLSQYNANLSNDTEIRIKASEEFLQNKSISRGKTSERLNFFVRAHQKLNNLKAGYKNYKLQNEKKRQKKLKISRLTQSLNLIKTANNQVQISKCNSQLNKVHNLTQKKQTINQIQLNRKIFEKQVSITQPIEKQIDTSLQNNPQNISSIAVCNQ